MPGLPLRRQWEDLSLPAQLTALILLAALLWCLAALVAGSASALWGSFGVACTALAVPGWVGRRMRTAVHRSSVRLAMLADGQYEAVAREHGESAESEPLEAAVEQLADAIRDREMALQSSILQLREVEQLKTDFVSTVSHELRTPLTSMRGALGLVLAGTTGDVPARARDLLRIAQQNTERLIRLINEMLDIEKIEAGHVPMKREWCELGALAHATMRGLEGLASEAGVTLDVSAPRDVFVSGDSDRIVQVLTNLASNAIKFSPRGETVRLTVEAEGRIARLQVIDRGPGIPPEFRSRIFGKFQQAESGDSRKASGTGLGLAIARAIVEMHDGSIGFDTKADRGTTFTVEFPWTPPTAAPVTADGYRILLVDEDLGMLSVLGTLCASLGETFGVRGSAEAWEASRTTRFDALVIDPAIPGGEELVHRLRRQPNYSDLPVLVFSGREFGPTELNGVAMSPAHVFVKARDREADVVMRLRAMLAVRRPRAA